MTRIISLSGFIAMCCIGSTLSAQQADSSVLDCSSEFVPATGAYRFVREDSMSREFAAQTRLGSIYYTRLPIFDENNPEENNALYRWANRFHILTRESTVSQQLLVTPGEQVDGRILDESERLLRSQGYFFDADIRPVRLCGDTVDIEVITKDNWSFTPNISADRSGGENTYSIGLREANILGQGKELGVEYSKDADRRSSELFYEDPNVMGTRLRNRTSYIDSDDGSAQQFVLGLPFFSLNSRRSWSLQLENGERQDEQFFRGDDVSEVKHDLEDYELSYGISGGLQEGRVQRWSLGYQYRQDEFGIGEELPPPAQMPTDRELSSVFLNYELLEDNYVTAFNLDQIYRTEDLHLGHRLVNRLGYASTGLGSDVDRLVVDGFYSDTLFFNGDMFWQHSLEWEGLWNLDTSEAEDFLVNYQMRYFRRQTDRRSFFASLEAVYSRNLNTHRQVVLGGSSGVRAFENRFQVGDRSIVLNLEERIYSDIHLFNLIRVGGAVFVDVGRAWQSGVDSGMEDDLLADVGFGLRLASSKAASGRVAHIDFAFPLSNRDDRDVDNFQISFTIKGSF